MLREKQKQRIYEIVTKQKVLRTQVKTFLYFCDVYIFLTRIALIRFVDDLMI